MSLENDLGRVARRVDELNGGQEQMGTDLGKVARRVDNLNDMVTNHVHDPATQGNSQTTGSGQQAQSGEVTNYGHNPGAVVEAVQMVTHRFHIPDDRTVEHNLDETSGSARVRLVPPPPTMGEIEAQRQSELYTNRSAELELAERRRATELETAREVAHQAQLAQIQTQAVQTQEMPPTATPPEQPTHSSWAAAIVFKMGTVGIAGVVAMALVIVYILLTRA